MAKYGVGDLVDWRPKDGSVFLMDNIFISGPVFESPDGPAYPVTIRHWVTNEVVGNATALAQDLKILGTLDNRIEDIQAILAQSDISSAMKVHLIEAVLKEWEATHE